MITHQDGHGRRFYERLVAYLQANDVEGLTDQHYCEDALLVGLEATAYGRPALKEYSRRYLQRLGQLELVSTDNFTETGDTIFLEATVKTALGTGRVYNAFVLREGKIAYHFAGAIGPQPSHAGAGDRA